MALERFEIAGCEDFAGGHLWGAAGRYERLTATAHYAADPADPRNAIIHNLDRAPKRHDGKVDYSAPVVILKPADPARGNGKLFFCINNRGMSELGPSAEASKVGGQIQHLLRQGFTLVDVGWHGDGTPNAFQLFPVFPVAHQADGSPITGQVRLDYSFFMPQFSTPLAPMWRAYPAADTDTAKAQLFSRERAGGPATRIAGDQWAFGTLDATGKTLTPTATDISLFAGFSTDRLYELVYTARDPFVMGLAYAVVRDLASFLRFATLDNPLGGAAPPRLAYAYGASSTGMYLREYLYLGFNEDEQGRKLFDGMFINTGGANRLFANVEFAHPTFFSAQDGHQDSGSNALHPATFGVTRDPLTGVADGILKRPATDPKVIEAVDENSFWTWKNSLQVVNGAGEPVAIPDDVRLYFKAGQGHIGIHGIMSPPLYPAGIFGEARYLSPSLDAPMFNPQAVEKGLPGLGGAMFTLMDDWVDKGIAPPDSNFPALQNGELVTLEDYRAMFPSIPGFEPPDVIAELDVLDFGPDFGPHGGRMTMLPPRHGARYQLFVPKPDADGIAMAAHRPMEAAVPIGTNVGWNIRREGHRAGDLCGLEGAFMPFANSKAERDAAGDPRLSLEERYGDHAGFVAAVKRAADDLVAARFMLEADAIAWVAAAQASDVLRA
jgi:Alpha/beta hydrolase domain